MPMEHRRGKALRDFDRSVTNTGNTDIPKKSNDNKSEPKKGKPVKSKKSGWIGDIIETIVEIVLD